MKNGYRYFSLLLMIMLCVAMLSMSAFALDVDMGILEATVEAVETELSEEAETIDSPKDAEEMPDEESEEVAEAEESSETMASFEENSEVLNASGSVCTESELREALSAVTGWTNIYVYGDIILTEDLTIPEKACVSLEQGTTFTVPDGITLTCNETMYVDHTSYRSTYGTPEDYFSDSAILRVNGTLNNQDQIVVGIYGELIVNGRLEGDGRAQVYVACEDDMEIVETLSEVYECDVEVNYDITLKEDFTIGEDMWLRIYHGATFTVPQGTTLTNKRGIQLGIMGYQQGVGWYVSQYGTLNVEGSFVNNGNIGLTSGGEIIGGGELTGSGSVSVDLYSGDDLNRADAFRGLYGIDYEISGYEDDGCEIILENNFIIGENDSLLMTHDAVLTVPAGVTMTNYGHIQIGNGGDTTDECFLKIEGSLVNHGFISVWGQGIETVENGTVEGYGYIGVNVWDEEDIRRHAGLEQARLEINNDITLTEDITLKGIFRCIGDAVVTVPEGITLVNDGSIHIGETYGLEDENGEIEWFYVGGTLDIQGEFINNGRVYIEKLGRLILNGKVSGKGEVFSTMAGDVDGDGLIETEDLIKLMKYTAGEERDGFEDVTADVNGDGVADILDIIRLVRYLSGEDVVLC